jgi:regulator of RNase E activity RraA
MRLKQRGAVGLVTDGAIRDAANVVDSGLPVFAGGATPTVGETRIMPYEVNVPIQCGNVLVWPGDVVLGADDGVVVVPAVLAEEIADEAERHDDVERAIMDYVDREHASPSQFYPFNDLTYELYERFKSRRPK